MSPLYYIGTAVISCGFIFVGWNDEGRLAQICLIIGGFCLGATITDALNYDETKQTTEG